MFEIFSIFLFVFMFVGWMLLVNASEKRYRESQRHLQSLKIGSQVEIANEENYFYKERGVITEFVQETVVSKGVYKPEQFKVNLRSQNANFRPYELKLVK